MEDGGLIEGDVLCHFTIFPICQLILHKKSEKNKTMNCYLYIYSKLTIYKCPKTCLEVIFNISTATVTMIHSIA